MAGLTTRGGRTAAMADDGEAPRADSLPPAARYVAAVLADPRTRAEVNSNGG
ncbi:hypothetical protein AB0442_17945 [Kitasatospora sp. NPDC085895]|uniref:hypothetical protein n=1 Tax=Kitasatospora sp. NPDC085895 TaxID=3155057 RepID=UPI00344FA46D